MSRRFLILCAMLALAVQPARAQVPAVVKVGVLNDMNGPFADQSGRGSVLAAQMAAARAACGGL